MQTISPALLDELTHAAHSNPRRRKNFNLHRDYSEPCQRLLNAVEPDSYIRPHRHLTPPKPETFLVLRGRFAAVIFRNDGEVERAVSLVPGETAGVDIPPGAWHTIIAFEPGSVFFETKPGPYEPISDKDWAPWAPPEGSEAASGYMSGLRDILQRSQE